jgi:hypothetical protein
MKSGLLAGNQKFYLLAAFVPATYGSLLLAFQGFLELQCKSVVHSLVSYLHLLCGLCCPLSLFWSTAPRSSLHLWLWTFWLWGQLMTCWLRFPRPRGTATTNGQLFVWHVCVPCCSLVSFFFYHNWLLINPLLLDFSSLIVLLNCSCMFFFWCSSVEAIWTWD